MFKRFGLVHILVFFAVIIVAGAIYIIQKPASNSIFQQGLATQDTSAFSSYVKGEVSEVAFEQIDELQNSRSITQQLIVTLIDSKKAGEAVSVENIQILDQAGGGQYKVGDKLVLGLLPAGTQASVDEYVIVDRFRLSGIYIAIGVFLLLAVLVGRRRGITSLVGLGITGAILFCFIAPQILSGKDPFTVSLVGAGAIVLVSMFISHGFSRRIQISAVSTLVSLACAGVITYSFVLMANLFGFDQGDAFLLETGFAGSLNMRGVLLAGIVISVLGILDDITTAQTAAVEEIYKTDQNQSFKVLYRKGLSIGSEHIASLINTLILVYVGSALPLFLLLTLQKSLPIWVLVNSEFIATEIVKALIGSITLILAVPIATLLAAYLYARTKNR